MSNQTVTVLEADGVTETVVDVLGFTRQTAALSKSIATCTEDKAVLDAIAASLAILDNIVAGSEAQVDVVTLPSLPSGTNGIGKLTANSGIDIGDVDVTSVIPGVAATNLGKAEDAAHASGDTGVMFLAVRQDTQSNLAADGDYLPPTIDASGNLRVTLPSTQVASVLDVQTTVTRPSDTTQYAASDAWSNSTSAPTAGGFTFANAASASGGGGTITDAVIVSSAAPGTTLQGECWLFDQTVTAINDNTAFALSDADALFYLGKIPFTLTVEAVNNSEAHVTGLNITYHCVGSTNLRYLIRVLNTYTPASGETLTIRLKGIRS